MINVNYLGISVNFRKNKRIQSFSFEKSGVENQEFVQR